MPQDGPEGVLRSKRKARGPRELKACLQCRQRKVRCDRDVPCRMCRGALAHVIRSGRFVHTKLTHCADRGHPDLCEYQKASSTPSNKRRKDARLSSGVESFPLTAPLTHNTESPSEIGAPCYGARSNIHCVCCPQSEGTDGASCKASNHAALALRTSFLDQCNHLADIHGVSRAIQGLAAEDTSAFFGLDNASATYPFVDLWGLPHGSPDQLCELTKAFPSDTDCWLSFKAYKNTAHTLFPVLDEPEALEDELLEFLITRRRVQNDGEGEADATAHKIFGKDMCWIALVFAILASGSQCSSLERAQRELTSKVYVCCSFECLRIANFLANPNAQTIKTLLVLGNVLCNNLSVGVAWSLLGLTIRLQQSCELCQRLPQPPHASGQWRQESIPAHEKIWWCIMWQDNFLSMTAGRAPSAAAYSTIALATTSRQRSYTECLTQLSKIGIDLIQERTTRKGVHVSASNMAHLQQRIDDVLLHAADHLREREKARSRQERMERASLHMLVSFTSSELCRPALDPTLDGCILVESLRATCVRSLMDTVEAFFSLQDLTPFARRSWFAAYRVTGCALLLSILQIPSQDLRARSLITRLISTLDSTTDPTEMSTSMENLLQVLTTLLGSDGSV